MKAKVVVPVLAICALATSAAPAGAAAGGSGQSEANASCVGLFASNVASAQPGFGQGISEEAQASRPFGSNVVAPFAHERFPCP
jgi:hypothetical protein